MSFISSCGSIRATGLLLLKKNANLLKQQPLKIVSASGPSSFHLDNYLSNDSHPRSFHTSLPQWSKEDTAKGTEKPKSNTKDPNKVTMKDLADLISEKDYVTCNKKQITEVLQALKKVIAKAVLDGKTVSYNGLGIWTDRIIPAREYNNLQEPSGKKIPKPEMKGVSHKVSKSFRDVVRGEKTLDEAYKTSKSGGGEEEEKE